ncbi:unnamed protein product [Moneuplotes crassus]|uniref:Uncharacterized protein n=1 Tax=Euplotes crassus TaxID=5936 RepID=A0AAD1Y7Y2_EUPCR|nr:unnamed protein product [Moneuplotes crassus]
MIHEDYSLKAKMKRFLNQDDPEHSESNFSQNSRQNNSQEPRKPKPAFPNINYLRDQKQSPRGSSMKNEIRNDIPLTVNRNTKAKRTLDKRRKTGCNNQHSSLNNKVTRIIKCDLIREPRGREEGVVYSQGRVERESTVSPVIKSISEFDYDNPLSERQHRNRGKSEISKHTEGPNILFKLGNLDEALLKAQTLLDNKPKDENYLYLKGRVLEKLNRENEAETCFQEALEVNPKFSQAAFYLAAIENKRGNFEKSIDLYNYALSKDQIPVGNYKNNAPILPTNLKKDVGSTLKHANFCLRPSLADSLKPGITNISNNKLKSYEKITNFSTTMNQKKLTRHKRISHPDPKIHKSGKKPKNLSPKSTARTKTMENSPVLEQKKSAKVGRLSKNRVKKHKNNSENNHNKYPVTFCPLGSSLNKAETVSLSSGNQPTTNVQSSQDEKTSLSSKALTKSTQKTKKTKKMNFSDRMLSSKLYSIKRQEIFLYNKQGKQKNAPKSQNSSLSTSRVKKSKPQKAPSRYFKSPKYSAQVNPNPKNQLATSKVYKNSKSSWNCTKPRLRGALKVDLADTSGRMVNSSEKSDKNTKPFTLFKDCSASKNQKINLRYHNSTSQNGSEVDCSDTYSIIQKHFNTDRKSVCKTQARTDPFESPFTSLQNNRFDIDLSKANIAATCVEKKIHTESNYAPGNHHTEMDSESYTRNTDLNFSKVLHTKSSEASFTDQNMPKKSDDVIINSKSYHPRLNPPSKIPLKDDQRVSNLLKL